MNPIKKLLSLSDTGTSQLVLRNLKILCYCAIYMESIHYTDHLPTHYSQFAISLAQKADNTADLEP
jgi:hypothetical protein